MQDLLNSTSASTPGKDDGPYQITTENSSARVRELVNKHRAGVAESSLKPGRGSPLQPQIELSPNQKARPEAEIVQMPVEC